MMIVIIPLAIGLLWFAKQCVDAYRFEQRQRRIERQRQDEARVLAGFLNMTWRSR